MEVGLVSSSFMGDVLVTFSLLRHNPGHVQINGAPTYFGLQFVKVLIWLSAREGIMEEKDSTGEAAPGRAAESKKKDQRRSHPQWPPLPIRLQLLSHRYEFISALTHSWASWPHNLVTYQIPPVSPWGFGIIVIEMITDDFLYFCSLLLWFLKLMMN